MIDSHALVWPLGRIDDEVDNEALTPVGRGSELSNEAPSLLDEEESPPKVAEPSDAGTLEQDVVVLVTPSKVAKPLDAGISEEEDTATPVNVARKVIRLTLVDETKPLVEGDWVSDKDIISCLKHKLYHNEISEPHSWTMALTYIVSRLNIMKKCKGSQGLGHTTTRVAWRRRHMFIINSDDRGGLYWFVPWTTEC